MTRPPVPLPGTEYESFADFENVDGWHRWTTDPAVVEGKRCRGGSPRYGWCQRPAVAAMDRGRVGSPRWYAYCEEHMYGRWVEDGLVMAWRLRRKEGSDGP